MASKGIDPAFTALCRVTDLGRKPFAWADVVKVSRDTLTAKEVRWIAKLGFYKMADVYTTPGKNPSDDFDQRPPGQVFVITDGDQVYLVDTQGYGYMRYAVRLV